MLASAGAAAAVAAADSSSAAHTTPSAVAEALNRRFVRGDWRRTSARAEIGVFVTVLERLWFESAPAQPWRLSCPEIFWPDMKPLALHPPRGNLTARRRKFQTNPCAHGLGHKLAGSVWSRRLALAVDGARRRSGNFDERTLPLWILGRGVPGFVLPPETPVWCAYAGDGGSDQPLCEDPLSIATSCHPGCRGDAVRDVRSMLAEAAAKASEARGYAQNSVGGANEVIFDANWVRRRLPSSIEAFFTVRPAFANKRCKSWCDALVRVASKEGWEAPRCAAAASGGDQCDAYIRDVHARWAVEYGANAAPLLVFDLGNWSAPFSVAD